MIKYSTALFLPGYNHKFSKIVMHFNKQNALFVSIDFSNNSIRLMGDDPLICINKASLTRINVVKGSANSTKSNVTAM